MGRPGCRWLVAAAAWQGGRVTEPVPDQAAPGLELAGPTDPADWLTLPDVAERLDVSISKVHQMIRDRELLAVRRDGVRRIPADLVANQTALKHLPGVLNLLADNGYDDEAVLRWLYEPDDTLPGATPAAALSGDQAREVKRRAQAQGF
ncbi:helix-turn-helix domain-containing protein [Micromonospora sp. H61]|nr:helix-turn-helix domain-containing protein [Micromonospora sp. H61]MBQ0994504.1 helix-turn-helix domain-containing protein [Micromonospora sp. H61]